MSDEQIKQETGLSREDHENRNQFNELPKGKIKPSPKTRLFGQMTMVGPGNLTLNPMLLITNPTQSLLPLFALTLANLFLA